ncbi:hypothetical protein VKS41_008325 [Umbelopsis sp. WA50703]
MAGKVASIAGVEEIEDMYEHTLEILDANSLKDYIEYGLLVDDPAGTVYAEHDIPPYVPLDCIDELAQGGIRPTEKGLAVIDSIIPKILQVL